MVEFKLSLDVDLLSPVTSESRVREFYLPNLGASLDVPLDSAPGLAEDLPVRLPAPPTDALEEPRRDPVAAYFSANLFLASSVLAAALAARPPLILGVVPAEGLANLEAVGASEVFLAIYSRTAFYFSSNFCFLSSAAPRYNPLDGVFRPREGVVGSARPPFSAIFFS